MHLEMPPQTGNWHVACVGRRYLDVLKVTRRGPTTPHQFRPQSFATSFTSDMSTTSTSVTSAHVKTRFLVISDTHSASPSHNVANSNVSFRPPLPKADVLLHCGDLTMIGHLDEYDKTLDMLENINADLKLIIAGNHDITLDEEYYVRKGPHMHRSGYDRGLPAKARNMWKGERARKAGVTYLEEGTHQFKLPNGANLRVYTSTATPNLMT